MLKSDQIKKITKIEVQKKRKNRFSIHINDAYAFGVDQEILLRYGLKKGDELSDQDVGDILLSEEKYKAKERALRLLSYRDRSEKEIIDRLKRIGYRQSIIDWVLSELKRLKLIDDARFSVSMARTKMISKPVGEFLLRRELAQKGIADGLIEDAITRIYEEKDQSELAFELAEKQFQKFKNLEKIKAKKRISDFLLRRGFHWDVINDAIEKLDFIEEM